LAGCVVWGVTIEDIVSRLVQYSMCKGGMSGGEYEYSKNGATHWNVMFIQPIHDWELDEVSRFFKLLYSQQVRHSGVDKMCWIPSKRKNFGVKSYYKVRVNLTPMVSPWKIIWKSKAPSIVTFFVWIVVLGKILMLDNLRKKNIIATE
jgi:hypothetical protein